jgi:hypothetical protein
MIEYYALYFLKDSNPVFLEKYDNNIYVGLIDLNNYEGLEPSYGHATLEQEMGESSLTFTYSKITVEEYEAIVMMLELGR